MLEVTIKSISITDIGFVVFLKSEIRERVLPIFIGPVEAQAISMVLMGNKPKRPMTHDLTKAIVEITDFRISKVEITEMKHETYFASLYLSKKGIFQRAQKEMIVDARPSDAIALAIRFNCPMYVDPNLFDEHGIELNDAGGKHSFESKQDRGMVNNTDLKGMGVPKKVNDEIGLYKQMLEEAIKEERFEDASKIRDKIDIMIQNDN